MIKKALRTFDDIVDAYRSACTSAFAWHDRIVSPGVHCKAGCDACCHGLFDVTILDILMLRQAYLSLPKSIREHIRTAAEAFKKELSDRFSAASFAQIEEKNEEAFFEHFKTMACPFLYHGQCAVYESRTYICRMTGIPFYDGEIWDESPICDINYRNHEYLSEKDSQKKYHYDEMRFFTTEESLLEQIQRLSHGEAQDSVYAYYVIPDFIDFCTKEDESDE